MNIQLLNSFRGDANKEIDTSTEEGRQAAAKLVGELIRSGSAIFLEREVDGETKTYRVTGYDPETDRLKITLPVSELGPVANDDPVIAEAQITMPRGRRGHQPRTVDAHVPCASGRAVSVAPVSGGLDVEAPPEGPRDLSWEAVRWGLNQICEERGWHHGCPMPSASAEEHRLIVAKGAPLGDRPGGILDFVGSSVRACRDQDMDEDPFRLVNSWTPRVTRVDVYRDSKGTVKLRVPYVHTRLMGWLNTMRVRAGAVDANTELVAMRSLQEKISPGQWDSYLLSGMFPEKSPTSPGVVYILRKGMPTIAITERPRPDGNLQIKFLAALCLHPLGYFENTWAGCHPPSDDVIAHLLMIRGDEHFLWRKANAHAITDPQAAI